jgi:hypothetical protein
LDGGKGIVTTAKYRLWNINKDTYPFWTGYAPNGSGIDWSDTADVKLAYGYRVGVSGGDGFIGVDVASSRPTTPYYYIPENNRRLISDFNYRNSTYAAIKAKYTPQGGFHYAAISTFTGVGTKTFTLSTASGAASTGDTFWRLIKENIPVGYVFNPALPDTAIFTSKTAVKQIVYHFTTGSGATSLESGTPLDAITDAIINAYFIEYKDGEAWYRYDLGEGTLDNSVEQVYAAFDIGIHRNTAYWASITGYKGLGQPREEDLNIEGPMVNGPTFLTVEAHVIPWTEAEGTAIL